MVNKTCINVICIKTVYVICIYAVYVLYTNKIKHNGTEEINFYSCVSFMTDIISPTQRIC